MNFLSLAQAVKRESGLSGSVTAYIGANAEDTRVFNWVNWAARDVFMAREDWRFRRGSATLASTTSQSNAATAFGLTDFASWKRPSGDYRPSAYRVSDGLSQEKELAWMDYDLFRKQFYLGSQTAGNVQYWSVSPDEAFLIGPAPDSAHFIRADYIKDYTDLTADADIPVIPTRFHMIIVWRALLEYGGFDAAGEVAQRASSNYASMWTQLVQSQTEAPSFAAKSLA